MSVYTISVSHVHWTIKSHNLSLEVVILFHRFLVLTVDKLVLLFYHETRTDCSRDSIYIYWYAGMRYVVYLVILRLASLLLSGLIDLKLYVSELRGTSLCITHPETLAEYIFRNQKRKS